MSARLWLPDAVAPTLDGALAHWAAVQPDAPFVIDAETSQVLSYGAFWRNMRTLQRWLGADPRTILLALSGGGDTALIWLAALTGGHRLVPCAPDTTPAEHARLLTRWQPDLCIAEPASADSEAVALGAALLTRARLRDLLREGTVFPYDEQAAPPLREGELWLTTSGTTGAPKGVRLRARQIAWTAEQIRISHRLTPADRGLAVLPFFHINAPVVSLCATLRAGGAVVIAPRFSRRQFWSWIERERVTWASLVPTIVALLLQAEDDVTPPASLRFVRTASAPLPAVQLLAFERRFRTPVIETYGLSEAASTVTANPVPPGQHKPGSVGLPLGLALRVCAPADNGVTHLREVAPRVEGEICVRGPSVIAGYADDVGDVGDAAFVDGWFRTGDLGYRDDEGYVYITGRLRDVINHGGHKIAPREIEETLLAHPWVRDVAVVGEADPIYGQRVVAYVVARAEPHPAGLPLEECLRAYCVSRLSAYKVPAAFVIVAALPRTATGKIQRHTLRRDLEPQVPVAAVRRASA